MSHHRCCSPQNWVSYRNCEDTDDLFMTMEVYEALAAASRNFILYDEECWIFQEILCEEPSGTILTETTGIDVTPSDCMAAACNDDVDTGGPVTGNWCSDLTANIFPCVTVSFSGITIEDRWSQWGGTITDEDCPDFPKITQIQGLNRTFRGLLSPGGPPGASHSLGFLGCDANVSSRLPDCPDFWSSFANTTISKRTVVGSIGVTCIIEDSVSRIVLTSLTLVLGTDGGLIQCGGSPHPDPDPPDLPDEVSKTLFSWTAAGQPTVYLDQGEVEISSLLDQSFNSAGRLHAEAIGVLGGTAKIRLSSGFCGSDPPYYQKAQLCGGTSKISVDPSTNTAFESHLKYQDTLHVLTQEETEQNPLEVTWVEDVCPSDQPEQYALATRCSDSGISLEYPATVVYKVNPSVGLGNGTVTLVNQFLNPACDPPQAGRTCLDLIRYRPTTTLTDPPNDNVTHGPGVTCGSPSTRTCVACRPGPVDPGPESEPSMGAARYNDPAVQAHLSRDPVRRCKGCGG